jgi:hypothetical protein
MILSVKEIEKNAKAVGAKNNYGVEISVRLRCRWIAWILNKLYRGKAMYVFADYGEIKDGSILHKSIWNLANIGIDKVPKKRKI